MDRRINTAQGINFNNVSVDGVYYNNEHIWPTGSASTPWSPSTDITTVAWIMHQILQLTQEVEQV